jgi:hypothetical protein
MLSYTISQADLSPINVRIKTVTINTGTNLPYSAGWNGSMLLNGVLRHPRNRYNPVSSMGYEQSIPCGHFLPRSIINGTDKGSLPGRTHNCHCSNEVVIAKMGVDEINFMFVYVVPQSKYISGIVP